MGLTDMPFKNMLKQENGNEGKQILVYQYARMHNQGIGLHFSVSWRFAMEDSKCLNTCKVLTSAYVQLS